MQKKENRSAGYFDIKKERLDALRGLGKYLEKELNGNLFEEISLPDSSFNLELKGRRKYNSICEKVKKYYEENSCSLEESTLMEYGVMNFLDNKYGRKVKISFSISSKSSLVRGRIRIE